MLPTANLALFHFYFRFLVVAPLDNKTLFLVLTTRHHEIVARLVVMLKVNVSPSARVISEP